jgi:multisubunit Na+/H+ antiporter MnhC subunit
MQCIYALDVFVLFMLGMEGVMPGSVTPYVDPLPFAVCAMAASIGYAIFARDTLQRWFRRAFLVCAALVAIGSFLIFQDGSGMRIRLALGIGIAMIVLIAVMLDGEGE